MLSIGRLKACRSLLRATPDELRRALASPDDLIVTTERAGEPRAVHVARRTFRLDGSKHELVIVRTLTREVARQEALTYKNAIRLINHELNNSLAPLSSLLHSAREIVARAPKVSSVDPIGKLDGLFEVASDRIAHLTKFLEGYAEIARLPAPAPRDVSWEAFLVPLRALFPFRVTHVPAESGHFDPAQIEQLLINLLKNARESGSRPEDVELAIARGPSGDVVFAVSDRGAGADESVLKNAMLPFYSTKHEGRGVGLALCREIATAHGGSLVLRAREGGGVEAECRLPGAAPSLEGRAARD